MSTWGSSIGNLGKKSGICLLLLMLIVVFLILAGAESNVVAVDEATPTPTATPPHPNQGSQAYLPTIFKPKRVINYFDNPKFAGPDEQEPNGRISEANGALYPNRSYHGRFSSTADTDDYYYFIARAGHVTITLNNIPSGQDYDLVMYDQALQRLAFPGLPGTEAETISLDLPAGIYYVQVNNYGEGTHQNQYALEAVFPPAKREQEPNNSIPQANGPLAPVQIHYGNFLRNDDEFDVYYFELLTAGSTTLQLNQIPAGQDLNLLLLDANTSIIGHSDNSGNQSEQIEVELSAGKYYAVIDRRSGADMVNNYAFSFTSGSSEGATCIPPTENPPDQWHSNRGYVETGAVCQSTMSAIDMADYYTYVPEGTGTFTLHLRDLPQGAQWSAMIFTDTDSPDYAPGDSPNGQCRITQPGSGDKSVNCYLDGGAGYFVKVSTGSTPVLGSYEMTIVHAQ